MYINAYVRTAMIPSRFLLALPLASHLFSSFSRVDFCAWSTSVPGLVQFDPSMSQVINCINCINCFSFGRNPVIPSRSSSCQVLRNLMWHTHLQVRLRKIPLVKCVTQSWVANILIPGCTGQLRRSLDSSCSSCPTSRNCGCSCRTLFSWTPTTATFLFRVLEIPCRRISHVGRIGFTGLGKHTNT